MTARSEAIVRAARMESAVVIFIAKVTSRHFLPPWTVEDLPLHSVKDGWNSHVIWAV